MAERVRYDAATRKWFEKNRRAETTVCRCPACGLYYKAVLGHKCKEKGDAG
ncbi:MAG: hypothetical protein IJ396_05635 [Oscillibacter sp.]|nr:hypothetical protein [Oscillibacter sp.]